ncbi:AAA family ATPase [Gluconacetobacter tumulicola]|uniref:AAA family ATPase n=1 Tax=Gluconacetobacter tumulicola TaxID=1017177 RepID=A0A7W4JG22_9PROT|nr:AAA family ATPase [Gluconacetobacter tumulicola]MBB2180439.1 AAA family ATPase [Gluconacetobacter tumulicola]
MSDLRSSSDKTAHHSLVQRHILLHHAINVFLDLGIKMLKEIRLSNFKAFGKTQKIPLGRVTLIYGPNSAGKSSIIQSILLMRQSVIPTAASANESKVVFRGEDVDLGNFKSALYKHDTDNRMQIGFSFDGYSTRGTSPGGHFPRSTLRSIDVNIDTIPTSEGGENGDAWINEVKFGVLDYTTSLVRVAQGEKSHQEMDEDMPSLYRIKDLKSAEGLSEMIHNIDRRSNNFNREKESNSYDINKNIKTIWKDWSFFPISSLPSQTYFNKDFFEKNRTRFHSDFFHRILFESLPFDTIRKDLLAEFANLSYLGPLRSPPARHYIVSGGDRGSVGQRGERMPQLLYRRKSKIIPRINEKLAQFKIPYTINVANAGNSLTGDIIAISLTDADGVILSPSDVGFGIGQLMPILVEGTVSTGKTICVEQPEIHLHPRLQGHLADFFINTSKSQAEPNRTSKSEGFGGNQWIVESHSEALILRLQTLIKKKSIPPEFVTVLYVQPTKYGSQVLHLRLDINGEFLDEWPNGFFEESFQEIFVNRQ